MGTPSLSALLKICHVIDLRCSHAGQFLATRCLVNPVSRRRPRPSPTSGKSPGEDHKELVEEDRCPWSHLYLHVLRVIPLGFQRLGQSHLAANFGDAVSKWCSHLLSGTTLKTEAGSV